MTKLTCGLVGAGVGAAVLLSLGSGLPSGSGESERVAQYVELGKPSPNFYQVIYDVPKDRDFILTAVAAQEIKPGGVAIGEFQPAEVGEKIVKRISISMYAGGFESQTGVKFKRGTRILSTQTFSGLTLVGHLEP